MSSQPLPPLPLARSASQGDASLVRQGSGGDTDKKCTCKHSKCVKLYCICWSAGVLCNSCLCQDCFNKPENEDFIRAEQSRIRSRNPLAFSGKVEQRRDGEVSHKIGCRCRRSQCIKKYCECFDGGVRCSSNCRCSDCYNRCDGAEGEDGLASLASAAQMAAGCLTEEPFQLTPGTAAAVAPYHLMGKSLPMSMSLPNGVPEALAADMSMWPGKQVHRMRHASDGEEGGEQPAGGKKRRSSSNSSSGMLAVPRAPASGPPGVVTAPGAMEEKFVPHPSSQAEDLPGAWQDSMTWAGPGAGPGWDSGAPGSLQAGSDGGDDSEGAGRDAPSQPGPSTAALPTRPTALPRPNGRHPERPWSGPAPPPKKSSSAMQSGGSILHHLQQQQQQMEAFLLHQQHAATMMAVSGGDMGMMYPSMSHGGYAYLMCPPPSHGGMMMMPMLSTAGSTGSQGTGMRMPSPHVMIEEEPMGAVQA